MLQRLGVHRRGLIGTALLAVPALTLLWWPQLGDQALFGQGGRVLVTGGVYWRDFWDVKQPGIFWLYGLGDRLGGVLGVRLLEIVAVLVAGVVVVRICRCWGLDDRIGVLAPLLVLGPYVLSCDANGVGQVEGLLTLPMLVQYLALILAARADRRSAVVTWAVLAGLAAGAVAALKLLYLPLGVVLLVAVLLEHRRGAEAGAGAGAGAGGVRAGAVAVGWSLGLALPLGAMAAYAVVHDVTELAFWSTVVAPGEVLASGLFSSAGLLGMVRALLVATTIVGPAAVVALWVAVRRRRFLPEAGLLAWAAGAALLVAPQLPTTYRMLVLLPPIGLLGVRGLASAAGAVGRWSPVRRVAVVAALLVLALPQAVGVARLTAAGTAEGWSLRDDVRLAVGDRIGGSPMIGPAAVIRPRIRPGTAVHVLGDPVVHRVLGTRPAIEMNGWGPEIMSVRMWRETVRELDRSRPEWIFVQQEYQPDVDRVPALLGLLASSYRPVDVPGAGGRWWRTDDPGLPAPSPEGNQLAVDRDGGRP